MEFKYYLKIFYKRKWTFLVILLLSVAIPLLLAVSSKKIYGISAKFMINKKDMQAGFLDLLPEKYGELAYMESASVYTNFLEIVKDESLHLMVIERMGLNIKPDSFSLSLPFFSFLLHIQDAGVNIEQVSDSDMYEIKGYASSPIKAADIANQILDVVIVHNQNLIRDQAARFQTVLENRLKLVNEELAAAESQKAQFMTEEKISDYNSQITAIYAEIGTLEYDSHKKEVKLKSLDKTQQKILATLKKIPEFQKADNTMSLDPSVNSAKNNLTDLMLKLAAKKNELSENHPDIIALKNQIETAKKTINSENLKFFASEMEARNSYYDTLISQYSNNEIEKIENQLFVEMTAKKIEAKKDRIRNLTVKGVALDNLDDQVKQLKKFVVSYVEGLEGIKNIIKMQVSNISVIRYADPKIDGLKAYFPSWKKVLFFGGMLGFSLAFFGTLFMEYLDDRWSDPEQLADSDLGPPACIISRSKENTMDNAVWVARQTVVGEQNADLPCERQTVAEISISDAIWELLSSIAASTEKQKMIAIVSSLPGEGKSTIGFFLAQAFAEKGEQVLFVDANFDDPALYRYFQGDQYQSERLSLPVLESVDLEGMTVKAIGPNLDLLTGSKLNFPAKILHRDRILKGLTILSGLDQYDRVILDLPSIQSHGAVGSLLAPSDVIIFVIALKMAKRSLSLRDVDQIKKMQSSARIKLAVNKA